MNTEPSKTPKQPPKLDFGSDNRSNNKKDDKSAENILGFVQENIKGIIVYVLLILSLAMLFFDSLTEYGSLIIGIIFGLYFVEELSYVVDQANALMERYGIIKTLVCGAALLALLIKAPLMLIGAWAVVLLKYFLVPENKKI